MGLKDIKPGSYKARVVDYGITMVEKLNAPKAFIQLAFKHDGQDEMITWDGFFFKKDGEINKKSLNCIMECGFTGKKIEDLNKSGALDTQKEVHIDIEIENSYPRVMWINSGAKKIEKVDVKKLKGMNLSKVDSFLAMANKGSKVKNYADDVVKPDDDDAIPF